MGSRQKLDVSLCFTTIFPNYWQQYRKDPFRLKEKEPFTKSCEAQQAFLFPVWDGVKLTMIQQCHTRQVHVSPFKWNLLQIMLFCLSQWNTPYSASDWPHCLADRLVSYMFYHYLLSTGIYWLISSRCKREKGCKGQKQSQRAASSRETSYWCPRKLLNFNLYLLLLLFIAFFELIVVLQLKTYLTFFIFSFAAVVKPTFDVSLNKRFCTLL